MKYRLGITLLVGALCSAALQAEVYRYKDADGKWRFSDKPPAEQVPADVLTLKENTGPQKNSDDTATGSDLAAYLTKKIQPKTDIEKATLAVVKIETLVGSGSAFFISDTGYLITNKHVVRPAAVSGGHSIEDQLHKHDEQLKKGKAAIDERSRELDRYESQIKDYEHRMERATKAEKTEMQAELDYHNGRYKTALADYQQAKDAYEKLNASLIDQKGAVSLSQDANRFKITFADDLVQEAELIDISPEKDLALLKIVGKYKTPFLKSGDRLSVPQGAEVFAIGSPLGMSDHVSKGIVSRHEKERIVIDAKIWPGNSGGALITPAGTVIGVNTAIYLADGTLGSQAFAYAIPMDAVSQEFAQYLVTAPEKNHEQPPLH